MMIRRALAGTLVAPLAVALVACSSTTDGSPTTSPPATGSSGSSGSTGGEPAGTQEFSDRVVAALQSVSSVHVEIVTSLSGQPLTVGGDETIAGGKLTGYRFSETLPGSSTPLVLVFTGGKTYVQPPASLNDTGKPWILVSPTSSNSFARTLATTLGQLQSSASVDSFGVLALASSDLRTIGDETVDGVEATHYAFTVDVAKLPGTFTGKTALQQAGVTSIPVDLWLDAQNRPVKAVQKVSVNGQQTSTTVSISDYNKPVTITAPPADQVSTS
jgi:hypothetical protein